MPTEPADENEIEEEADQTPDIDEARALVGV